MNILKITMQGTSCWLDLNLIPSDHELGGLACADICFVSNLYFAVCFEYSYPARPTIDNYINSDSQLFIFPFLIMSRAA